MFQLFLRARAHNFFSGRFGDKEFKARSPERDTETDQGRVVSVLEAIDGALTAALQEQAGLSRRVEDVLSRAAVTMGNNSDEYLEREPHNTEHQNLFGNEVKNGQRRLQELATSITHFKFLKTAMLTRFPDFKPTVSSD